MAQMIRNNIYYVHDGSPRLIVRKSEVDQKLIVKENAYEELGKEVMKLKQQLHKQKKDEALLNSVHKR